jgi:hypothetical protein
LSFAATLELSWRALVRVRLIAAPKGVRFPVKQCFQVLNVRLEVFRRHRRFLVRLFARTRSSYLRDQASKMKHLLAGTTVYLAVPPFWIEGSIPGGFFPTLGKRPVRSPVRESRVWPFSCLSL